MNEDTRANQQEKKKEKNEDEEEITKENPSTRREYTFLGMLMNCVYIFGGILNFRTMEFIEHTHSAGHRTSQHTHAHTNRHTP